MEKICRVKKYEEERDARKKDERENGGSRTRCEQRHRLRGHGEGIVRGNK